MCLIKVLNYFFSNNLSFLSYKPQYFITLQTNNKELVRCQIQKQLKLP